MSCPAGPGGPFSARLWLRCQLLTSLLSKWLHVHYMYNFPTITSDVAAAQTDLSAAKKMVLHLFYCLDHVYSCRRRNIIWMNSMSCCLWAFIIIFLLTMASFIWIFFKRSYKGW